MENNELKALELLFQRPLEPVFTSRDNGKAAFDVPDTFYTDRFSGVEVELQSRFGDDVDVRIPIRDIAKPNLDFAKQIGLKENFYIFIDKHKRIAGQLIKLFLDAKDRSTFISLAVYVKDRVNPMLFQYCYSIAVAHRKDTSMVPIPPVAEIFPANFIEPSLFKDARTEGSLIKNSGDRMTIDMSQNFTASDREEEQRLAYFREDIGVNMHHWHWHLVYPGEGPDEVVRKDRRGELFYYMHHQIIARYNVDRFCNGLSRARLLNNLREAIPEGYFPKILSSLNNRTFPARIAGQSLRNVERVDNTIEITEVERWADRIHQAIDQGYVVDRNNKQIPLDEVRGIDILGDLIEASALTVNRQLYGNLHNMGHNLISLAHDPDARFREDISVMGDVTTAMRDPIFYRWHSFIDQIFTKFKDLLPAYDNNQLGFNGVSVDSIAVQIRAKGTTPNTLATYWQNSDIDIGAGLDFGPNGAIYARYTHLQYAPFSYDIRVTNSGGNRKGTCRIFICPKADERGAPLRMNEIKNMAIELDKFTVTLNPGENTIRRRSSESSVTIPFERSFRRTIPSDQQTAENQAALSEFRFCGCGWPDHMLLPKGTPSGMEFDLYCMISDYTGDEVIQTNDGPSICGDAESFCGLKDKLYPDKRSMGFPFDRPISSGNLGEFTNQYPNMAITPIKIVFSNKHINRQKNRD
ncbi:phenoloxidase 2-like [Episyrphus balteatus]|uniref:phenoloxidase 2-like n=1 Tax=Episyrphus balteatus TaxID=286459 RepID=UPI002485A5DE|nr:phenoloxidase 2-like [Episyrphus balteatus]